MAGWCCRWAPLAIKSALNVCCCSAALFGVASLCAALSPTALTLIASRAPLAVGAAMIVPATLAGSAAPLPRPASAHGAGAVGGGGFRRRGLGPLVGGMLLEHFYWGSVFLINVPIVLVVIAINARWCRASSRAATSR